MTLILAPIVEGQTEAVSLERLLHRIWSELCGAPERFQVLLPSRGNRDVMIDPKKTELADRIEEAYIRLGEVLHRDPTGRGFILILLDAEGDCPGEIAPAVLRTATQAQANVDIACVLAKRMFENWILAGASTLGGVHGLPPSLTIPDQAEDRNGVTWLNEQLHRQDKRRRYKKTRDALVFIRKMNLLDCRANSHSFDKLCRELERRRPTTDPPAS